jgi:hypothetical protein
MDAGVVELTTIRFSPIGFEFQIEGRKASEYMNEPKREQREQIIQHREDYKIKKLIKRIEMQMALQVIREARTTKSKN